ncbi:hypothetical protein, conserved [Eimeria tenella]|uniref:SAM-dependent RNA methyltransferase n=1 Tax=Eimeria tenella TaxID=5802 RepID=U6KTK8_EIMTE|nr:hypothetical protein, conserved [Eimeria tenella]CDJ41306.1 hypothetical protein, conserved [Eimeria tenella]|eukprot:XP_013232056.1 hypothetical protein, conserved [Eimeria tenella]
MLYVIENVEEEIEQWCTLEYKHISETVGPSRAIFTSVPTRRGLPLPLSALRRQLADLQAQLRARVLPDSADTLEELNWDRVLLLDMDADQELTVADADRFDAVLVGGILGNVPSDDRTAEVRKLRLSHARHLGPLQMTTNTAVLVSKIILEDKVSLKDIPMVDEPEIPAGPNSKESLVLPFRYVAKSYLTKSESDKSEASQLPLSEVYRQLGSTASEHAFQLHSFSFFLFSFSTLRHPNFARRPAAFPYGKRQFPAAVAAAAAAEDLLQQQQESARAASRSAANAHMNMMI